MPYAVQSEKLRLLSPLLPVRGVGGRFAAKRDEVLGLELAAGGFAGLNEWVQVGDVRVRVTKVRVQDRVVVDTPAGRYEPAAPWLTAWIEVENRSRTKAVAYTRWSSNPDVAPPAMVLTDRYGNRCVSQDYFGKDVVIAGTPRRSPRDLDPGGGPVEDILCFDTPLDSAGDLWLTLDAAQPGEKGAYRFRIPAAE